MWLLCAESCLLVVGVKYSSECRSHRKSLVLSFLSGECLAGALEWRELIRIAMEIGFAPPVLVSSTLYKCSDPEIKAMLS